MSGEDQTRVFYVASGAKSTLERLTVANGKADSGGGIFNYGDLTVTNSTFSGIRPMASAVASITPAARLR